MLKKILFIALVSLGLLGSSLQAGEMKCGAGKCGKAMKCGAAMKAKGCKCKECTDETCAAKKDPSKKCDCNHSKKLKMKCGAGKCGKAMKH
jgi:hypothetical protein